jgi:hypothetical protein
VARANDDKQRHERGEQDASHGRHATYCKWFVAFGVEKKLQASGCVFMEGA